MGGPLAALPRLLAALAWLLPGAARAERAAAPVVVSTAPDRVAITLYRDNERPPGAFMDFDPGSDEPLGGYALVDEVRTIDLPPGEVIVRFEGVAGGIVPQSAILFTQALKEKNFDARLLSRRGLIDAFTGQRVVIRRADPATGRMREEPGTILTRPDGLVLRTAAGYEAVQCEGSLNGLVFPGRPVDLTAKPTLSLVTRADQPGGRTTLHLAYLAGNFDWQATYVGTFSPDAGTLRLMGWMTLASGDRTSFVDAEASAVAGIVARAEPTEEELDAEEEARENDPYAPGNIAVSAGCWPQGRTAASRRTGPLFTPGSLPTLDAPIALRLGYGGGLFMGCGEDGACDEIVVTARRRTAQTDLGDLKLYTIDRPTTVAAQSMKQVRFLEEKTLKGALVYRARIRGDWWEDDGTLVYRLRNRAADGLGEPLPQGRVILFQETPRGRQPVAETSIRDKAVDELVEIELPSNAGDVDFDDEEVDAGEGKAGADWTVKELTVRNDEPFPIVAEVAFADSASARLSRFSATTTRRDGRTVWRTTVPPGKTRTLRYRVTEIPEVEFPEFEVED